MMVKPWSRRAGALALAFVLGGSRLPAQQYWPDRGEGTVVRADFLKPFFKEEGYQFLTGTVFLSGSGPIGKSLRIEADIPLVRAGVSVPGLSEESSLRLGNPYVGLRIHRAGRPVSGYLGVRLPLTSEPTSFGDNLTIDIGALSDFDRFEAFLPNVFTVRTGVELRSVSSAGFLVGAKLGPSLLVSTEGGGDDAELFADYGVQGGYEGRAVRATIGLTGRLLVSEGGSFSQRTEHVVTGAVELRRGPVRPSVLIRLPLEKSVREMTSVTIGFGLAVVL